MKRVEKGLEPMGSRSSRETTCRIKHPTRLGKGKAARSGNNKCNELCTIMLQEKTVQHCQHRAIRCTTASRKGP
eukprot:1146111-Pelagomonas_calceolata.AAC.5